MVAFHLEKVLLLPQGRALKEQRAKLWNYIVQGMALKQLIHFFEL